MLAIGSFAALGAAALASGALLLTAPIANAIPEGTIKARLSRGRAALAALLTDEEGLSHA